MKKLADVTLCTGRLGRVELYCTPYLRNLLSATELIGVELLAA